MWTNLDSFFLCVFVAILFTPQCLVDGMFNPLVCFVFTFFLSTFNHHQKHTIANKECSGKRRNHKISRYSSILSSPNMLTSFNTVSSQCSCVSARNDYYYRYPEVAMANLDPVYHYQVHCPPFSSHSFIHVLC